MYYIKIMYYIETGTNISLCRMIVTELLFSALRKKDIGCK